MSFTELTTDLDNHQSLGDQPNVDDGLTSTQLKVLYDKAANDIKTYINDTLIAELENSASGSSGAQSIGYDGTDTNVADMLDTIIAAGTGTVPPDGTITNAKLATDVKIGSLALLDTTDKTDAVSAINEINQYVDRSPIKRLQETFDTSNGNWVCPTGVTEVIAILTGGGAGGIDDTYDTGGGSGYINIVKKTVVPSTSYAYTLGAGGVGTSGGSGGTTTIFSESAAGAIGRNGGSGGSYRAGAGGSYGSPSHSLFDTSDSSQQLTQSQIELLGEIEPTIIFSGGGGNPAGRGYGTGGSSSVTPTYGGGGWSDKAGAKGVIRLYY